MTKGKYIVLEGPEGVGKTSQLLELARRLQAAGLPVRTLREPDSQSDLTARAIRQLTQDPRYPMNTRTEVLLYNAARAQSLEVIKHSTEHGVICLVDRNYLTTLAIQYYGRGDVPDYEIINNIINFAVGGMEPDLCILLDAPVATLRKRLSTRYNGERFDNLDDAFLERVRAGYLWEAHQRKLPVIFATEDFSTVADSIWKLVSAELAVREASPAATAASPTSVKEIIQQKSLPAAESATPATAHSSSSSEDNPLVFRDISSLLALHITRGRRADYTETSSTLPTYHTPEKLKPAVKKQYTEVMDTLMQMHAVMQQRLRKDPSVTAEAATRALRSVLPLATTTTIAMVAGTPGLQSLYTRLLSQPVSEARTAAESLQSHATSGLEHSKKITAYRNHTTDQLQALAKQYLPPTHAGVAAEPVTLVDFWPKNELLLVADMLYEQSSLSLEELQAIISDWPYERKNEVYKTYIGKRPDAATVPGRALEKIHYSWSFLCDLGTYHELQRHQTVDDLTHQPLTPRYGYDIPALIEDAGLSDQYENCFDISLQLHSALQRAGYTDEAQYAILQGHKLRCKLTYNAREAFHLLESIPASANRSYQTLLHQMHEKLAEIHPLTAEAIKLQPST